MGSDRASWEYVACHIALRLVETPGSYKGFTLHLSPTRTQQRNVCLPPKQQSRCITFILNSEPIKYSAYDIFDQELHRKLMKEITADIKIHMMNIYVD